MQMAWTRNTWLATRERAARLEAVCHQCVPVSIRTGSNPQRASTFPQSSIAASHFTRTKMSDTPWWSRSTSSKTTTRGSSPSNVSLMVAIVPYSIIFLSNQKLNFKLRAMPLSKRLKLLTPSKSASAPLSSNSEFSAIWKQAGDFEKGKALLNLTLFY